MLYHQWDRLPFTIESSLLLLICLQLYLVNFIYKMAQQLLQP